MGNYLIFDGVKTSDYDVLLSGAGTYDAPKREVEMLSIPGRSGDYALDKGKYENIEVTYEATVSKPDNMATFRTTMDNLRNALASRIGYKRLEDTFHPDEYRMAMFKDGLEPSMVGQSTSSQFDLVFNCKPQRFLKSGETAVEISDGDTLTNPTLFEASPLLEVEGYGDIAIGDTTINIVSSPLGNVAILGQWQSPFNETNSQVLVNSLDELNTGDTFYVLMPGFELTVFDNGIEALAPNPIIASGSNADWIIEYVTWGNVRGQAAVHMQTTLAYANASFIKGTNGSYSNTITLSINETTITFDVVLSYSGDTITFSINSSNAYRYFLRAFTTGINGYSTKSSLGNPIYIDCEIGEAYKIEGGAVVGLNNFVAIGSDLPALMPGANTITFDNTITDLKIIPRWWKI